MKRIFAFLSLMILAACTVQPEPPIETPPDGDGPIVCKDSEAGGLQTEAIPIEFGTAYESTNGLIYYRAEGVGATTVSLRLDGMPSVGYLTYSVFNARTGQTAIVGNFDDSDGPIPASAAFTGDIDEPGGVIVALEYLDVDVQQNGCSTFQFMLTRE